MNPEQWQSSLRSLLLYVAGTGTGYLVTKGYMTTEQAGVVGSAAVTLALAGGSVAVAWWGNRSHSAPAITAAVNSNSAPGVKVVTDSTPAPAVNLTKAGAIVPAPKS